MIEHGEFEVDRSEQVILLSTRGPWNDETLKRGALLMNRHIKQVDFSQPWAQLSCLYGESLMTPSVFQNFVKHTGIRKDLGLNALAVVIKDSDIKSTILSQLSQAYNLVDVHHGFFDEIEQACEWFSEQSIRLDASYTQAFFDKHCFAN